VPADGQKQHFPIKIFTMAKIKKAAVTGTSKEKAETLPIIHPHAAGIDIGDN
jgi:hypothetical protein